MKSSQVPSKNLPMVGTTMVGHIHIMIIELLMKLDVILKNVGCTVTKMLDHNTVCACPGQNQRQDILLDLVHQQPIRLNMAFTVSFVIAVNS